jgi:hypothetical protein
MTPFSLSLHRSAPLRSPRLPLGDGPDAEHHDGVEAPPRDEGAIELDGFNLHAGVAIAGADDLGRERLMRYGARPPLALDRLRRLPDGRIAYRIKNCGTVVQSTA